MKVIGDREDSTKQVLVGQKNEAQAMGVSDDAALMSILSTSLYQIPLRSMLREIMFNAWDAHSVGNCQDRPIEVTVNRDIGIVVRDFGPGIPDDEIQPIYGVYGGTTKVHDKNQTGGFGLGTKSPFGYTESFTVISYNNDVKSIYSVVKHLDDASGKPGITKIISVPTEETGIAVCVPLVMGGDVRRAIQFIKDIMFLSGMKVNLIINLQDDVNPAHTEGKIYENKKLPTDGIHLSNDISGENGIFAVYGGVRYKILKDEVYAKEYALINSLSHQTMYLAFEPNSLTPLPSREGLTLSAKTKENIRIVLEAVVVTIRRYVYRIFRVMMAQHFKCTLALDIQPQFSLTQVMNWMNGKRPRQLVLPNLNMSSFLLNSEPEMNEDSLWGMSVDLCTHDIGKVLKTYKAKEFENIMLLSFYKAYPEFINRFSRLRVMATNDTNTGIGKYVNRIKHDNCDKALHSLRDITRSIIADLDDDKVKVQRSIMSPTNSSWQAVTDSRTDWVLKNQKSKALHKKFKIKEGRSIAHDRLWLARSKKFTPINQMFLEKVIILVPKKISLLTLTLEGNAFTASGKVSNSGFTEHYRVESHIPALIVPNRKGSYARAKQMLLDDGYRILESTFVAESRVKAPKQPYVAPTYALFSYSANSFRSYVEIEDPASYLYVPNGAIHDKLASPSYQLLISYANHNKKFCMLQYKRQETTLDKLKVPTLYKVLETWFTALKKNKRRFNIVCRIAHVQRKTDMSKCVLFHPEIQKCFDLKITPAEEDQLWYDQKMLQCIMEDPSLALIALNVIAKAAYKLATATDSKRQKTKNSLYRLKYFSQDHLTDLFSSPTLDENSTELRMLKKISKFIRLA